MTARPLTPDEARRVTTCPDCGCRWDEHFTRADGLGGCCKACLLRGMGCTRPDETLTQVAALRDEWQAAAWERRVLDQARSEQVGTTRGNPYRETKKDPTEKEN